MIKDMESSAQFCELEALFSEKLQKGELMEQEMKKEVRPGKWLIRDFIRIFMTHIYILALRYMSNLLNRWPKWLNKIPHDSLSLFNESNIWTSANFFILMAM